MGGTVITVELVSFVLLLVTGLGALWWRIEARDTRLEEKIAESKTALLEHKVQIISTFQTKEAAREVITEMLIEIRAMRLDFKTMLEGFDERLRQMEQTVAKAMRDRP